MKINIAIIEDHTIVRKGIIEILLQFGNYQIVIEASSGQNFIEQYENHKHVIDIIILDIRMPEMDGFETVTFIKKALPQTKILILTTYDEEYFLIKMIKLGVNGYLLKSSSPLELNKALDSIHHNSYYFTNVFSKRLKKLVESNFIKIPNITESERSFLNLCGENLTYSQMASIMKKSQRGVEGLRDSLFRKFEINNRASLVILAVKLGIIKL